jgi:hypothetical protein
MVDDEPRGTPEAARADPRALTVPSQDQQVRVHTDVDHLVLDPAACADQPFDRTPESFRGAPEQLLGGALGLFVGATAWIAVAPSAPQ